MGRPALTQEEFVRKANNLHDDKYNYDNTVYTNMITKINVTCPIHGEFSILPSNHVKVLKREHTKHLKPSGCPRCGREEVIKRNKKNSKLTPDFIKEANEVHDFKYSYANAHYIHSQVNLQIDCEIHGIFWQRPSNHLRGTGCPKCKNSKGETKIAKALSKTGVYYVKEHMFDDCVNAAGNCLPFDFYIASKSLLIEYDGEQHFKRVKFHANMSEQTIDEMFEKTQIHDEIKNKYAFQKRIRLVRIPYTQLNNITSIVDAALQV